jgi:hypothetical protein
MITGLLLARRQVRRLHVALTTGQVTVGPGRLRRLAMGQGAKTQPLAEIRRVGSRADREGTQLVLWGAGDPPVRLPLQHPQATEVAAAFLSQVPADAWDESARALATAVAAGPGRAGNAARDPYLAAAGLWHLAAAEAWALTLAHPTDPDAAAALWAVERHRLPTALRLRLALALGELHPERADLGFEAARLALALRIKDLARTTLDDLVTRADAPAPAAFWRTRLRERRAVPVPGSRATFGIEVNLPEHRLEGTELVVAGRFRADLQWFVAYRLLPGFWGPPHGFELVDLWGARHLLRGDPRGWAVRLADRAPHLCEVHDEGWIWPPLGPRLRVLDRAAREKRALARP